MADNIIIKITSEADLSEAQKQLAELTKRAKEQEKAMRDLSDTEKEDAKSIKALGLQEDELAKALQNNKKYYRDLRDEQKGEIAVTKQSIKELEKQIKAYNTLQGQSGRMVIQLRAIRERLMEMEEAGEFGTQAFVDLSIAAGQLEDRIGDTQQRIRILASDTKNMDAIMGLGDGLAGTFYIATSAAELFGDEIEGLQKAFYKVQAAMSVVSGAQQVYNALQKDSAAMVVLNTALTKVLAKIKGQSAAATTADAAASAADATAKAGEAAATEAAATAQWSLNAAFSANPIGFVIAGVAALAAGVYALYKIFDKTERRLREARKAYEKQSAYTEYYLIKYAQDHEKSMRSIEKNENKSLNEMKKRHASSLEINQEELKFLKERQTEAEKYAEKAIVENNKEIAAARALVDARAEDFKKTKAGSKAREDALKALTEAEEQWNNAVAAGRAIEDERNEARNAVVEKELDIEEELHSIRQRTEQARIDILLDGQAKEKAQINANYKEQLREIKGHGAEETALRKALEEKQLQELAELDRKYAEKRQKIYTEVDVQIAEEATKALTGEENAQSRLKVWENYYDSRKAQIEENARLEIEEVERSTDSEETKAAKILQINTRLKAEIADLNKERSAKAIEIDDEYLAELERAVVAAESKLNRAQTGGEKLEALREMYDAQLALYDEQQSSLDAKYQAGLITYQDYKQQEFEIAKEIADAEVEYQQQSMQAVADSFQTVLGYMQQVSDLAFEALSSSVQAELDALEKGYTTDYQEAQKNADKKYITQKEYEKKKAALEEKQAKYAKAQAIINAGIQTALAIVTTLAQLGATPWGIAASVIAAAMGAAQIGIIASKPLAQYAKGRKGGKGEYALVGEKGAELMYVPQGASIVPHDKINRPETWPEYNVPKLNIPEMPNVSQTVAQFIKPTDGGLKIDYDKLGEAVARNIPKQQAVTVNVDRSGISVLHGGSRRTYLNTKYQGSWR